MYMYQGEKRRGQLDCVAKRVEPIHTHTHTHTYAYTYINIHTHTHICVLLDIYY